uniref:Chemosensory protein 25 n=1 Tax=Heliconius charithonia TaxID=33434 RepID=A0AA49J0T3_HELCH|nr:chemosensory protein 25 [Heliconius charithonia]
MSVLLFTIFFLISSISSEMTAAGIDRTVSDGVRSMGYNVVYGDEDMMVINEVVRDSEKYISWKTKTDLNQSIPPLPAMDVKCLMSVDRYCSKKMVEMKNVLIRALKDDCTNCTTKEKESAGRIVASMMAHDPVAWKLFLTRYDSLDKVQRVLG